MASVELTDISKSFGKVEAVRDVSLSITDRELYLSIGTDTLTGVVRRCAIGEV